ncbi:protein LATERAL ROOT PRIMORDIUM 1-like [Lotus japonicus]|uniref:protein LATERAL ROOT PRIMORDIUM 1-like n=1 Tax=Lotus japonicus TaxID=34305 RepID=UPI00258D32D2|nr:protein LATERAL ROOT PRIMORDIUM 1-like [Lotus japonicus]XP_057458886.1 protein LATERAL ROOT PRIMORDIUM 1-like [Lotus japonicus]
MSMLGLRDLVFIAPNPSSLHHQHQHQVQPISSDPNSNLNPLPSSASLSVGFGIFPLLTATPCMPQQQHQQHPQNNNNEVQNQECAANNTNTNTNTATNYWNLKMCPEVDPDPPKKGAMNNLVDDDENHHNNNNKLVMTTSESEENGVYGPDFRVCQDCGNRAKKDCLFRRCRTCCKGRGYDCNTHVKSTWVPAVRRREREVTVVSGGEGGGGGDGGCSVVKRPKPFSHNATATSHSSNSNAPTPKSLANSSCHQDAGFKESLPGHVRAPAVFRCHRVTAIGNGEDEFAYLATVHISGHVFQGFLYDHGVGGKNACVSELQLGKNCSGKNGDSAIGVPHNHAYPASAS